ncbi:MAG: hypothetical protein MJ086_01100 [Lachnospiraceae bacterium]|nr:hypothetical protein [Lachnospiraceae bacterium]
MKIKKALTAILITGITSILLAGTALADGGVYVSDEYIDLENGSDTYVSITFDNAAGSYSVSSSGSVYANDEGWLDDESTSIGISTNGTGYGTVTISYEAATYDEEELSDSITIEVNVYEPEEGDTDYGKGEDENAPDTSNEAEKTEEKKTETESSKLDVKIDDKDYTILTDLKGIDVPKGFAEMEETFEGEKVKVLQYKESLKLYALKNKSDKTVLFYSYNPNTKKFEKPLSMTQGKKTYYFLELPADTDIAGYQKKEVTVNGETMQALVSDYAGMEDYCFVYAMNDGNESFYCVDNKENTIQRVSKFSIPMEDHEKQLEAKKVSLLDNKYVLIGAAVILAIIILLLILLIVTKKKYKEALEDKADADYASSYKSGKYDDLDEEADFDDPIDYEDTLEYEEEDDDFDDIFFDDLD